MPVPPDLVPELVIHLQDLLVVSTQEKRPELARGLITRYPFDLVTLGRVTDRESIGPDGIRLDRICGLGLRPSQPWIRHGAERTRGSVPRSGTSSQGRTGPLSIPASRSAKLTSPTDVVVRVEHTDNDASDPPLDDVFNARDFGAVSGRARLQCRKERCAGERLVRVLPLKECELGVLTLPKLASERLAEEDSVPPTTAPTFGATRPGSLTDWRARSTARSTAPGHLAGRPVRLRSEGSGSAAGADDAIGCWRWSKLRRPPIYATAPFI